MDRQRSVESTNTLVHESSRGRNGQLSRAYVLNQPVQSLKVELKHMFMTSWIRDPLIFLFSLGLIAVVAGIMLLAVHEHMETLVISIIAIVLGISQSLGSVYFYQKIYTHYKRSLTCIPRASLGQPFPTKEYPVLKGITFRSVMVQIIFTSGGALIPLGLFLMIGSLKENFDNGCIVVAVGVPLYLVYPAMLFREYFYFYLPNLKKEDSTPTKPIESKDLKKEDSTPTNPIESKDINLEVA
ncbi:unnamed protein product [Meganyctiphanes norvegica]|uniref:Uncharacterized protein n=1 Tax=Meganyctiphanes norvegica TaxID=48144 RepID=A0AAV2RG27_MEGNR